MQIQIRGHLHGMHGLAGARLAAPESLAICNAVAGDQQHSPRRLRRCLRLTLYPQAPRPKGAQRLPRGSPQRHVHRRLGPQAIFAFSLPAHTPPAIAPVFDPPPPPPPSSPSSSPVGTCGLVGAGVGVASLQVPVLAKRLSQPSPPP